MGRNVDDRYQSATEMREELEGMLLAAVDNDADRLTDLDQLARGEVAAVAGAAHAQA